MNKYNFCTLFDSNYLIKGVAMIQSLQRVCPEAFVFVLCMDSYVEEILKQVFPRQIHCIALKEIETEELLRAKENRGIAEYCWTLSPCLPWYVLENYPDVEQITYLDADLYFYSSVDPIFSEMGDCSIAITEHRFTPRLMDREIYGRFCVQWVSFRRDIDGIACLSRWKEQCIEWCYYRLESDRMGDQKYLDAWPRLYKSCHIIQNLGAGLAPWNYPNYSLKSNLQDGFTVNKFQLIFYHFHQFQLLSNGRFDRISSLYTIEFPEPDAIYIKYEKSILEALIQIRKISPNFSRGLKDPKLIMSRRIIQRYVPRAIRNILHKILGY